MIEFLLCLAAKFALFWTLCGLTTLTMLRLAQKLNYKTVVMADDVSGGFWWGAFGLIFMFVLMLCGLLRPLTYLPAWIGHKLGLVITPEGGYEEKGFFRKYLD